MDIVNDGNEIECDTKLGDVSLGQRPHFIRQGSGVTQAYYASDNICYTTQGAKLRSLKQSLRDAFAKRLMTLIRICTYMRALLSYEDTEIIA